MPTPMPTPTHHTRTSAPQTDATRVAKALLRRPWQWGSSWKTPDRRAQPGRDQTDEHRPAPPRCCHPHATRRGTCHPTTPERRRLHRRALLPRHPGSAQRGPVAAATGTPVFPPTPPPPQDAWRPRRCGGRRVMRWASPTMQRSPRACAVRPVASGLRGRPAPAAAASRCHRTTRAAQRRRRTPCALVEAATDSCRKEARRHTRTNSNDAVCGKSDFVNSHQNGAACGAHETQQQHPNTTVPTYMLASGRSTTHSVERRLPCLWSSNKDSVAEGPFASATTWPITRLTCRHTACPRRNGEPNQTAQRSRLATTTTATTTTTRSNAKASTHAFRRDAQPVRMQKTPIPPMQPYSLPPFPKQTNTNTQTNVQPRVLPHGFAAPQWHRAATFHAWHHHRPPSHHHHHDAGCHPAPARPHTPTSLGTPDHPRLHWPRCRRR